jgi:hypothetical protein
LLIDGLVHLKDVLVHLLDGLVRRVNGRLGLAVIDDDRRRTISDRRRIVVTGAGACAPATRDACATSGTANPPNVAATKSWRLNCRGVN